MKPLLTRRDALMVLASCPFTTAAAAASSARARVLIVVGPSNHPPGSHEVAAGGRLMKHCLETAVNVPGITAEVSYG